MSSPPYFLPLSASLTLLKVTMEEQPTKHSLFPFGYHPSSPYLEFSMNMWCLHHMAPKQKFLPHGLEGHLVQPPPAVLPGTVISSTSCGRTVLTLQAATIPTSRKCSPSAYSPASLNSQFSTSQPDPSQSITTTW